MPRLLVVIPGDEPVQIGDSPHLERLRAEADVRLFSDRPVGDDEKVRRLKDADILLNSRGQVTWPGDVLKRLPKLKMVTACGIGTDAIDVATARELGIVVCNIPGMTAPLVAEHTVALMLAAAKRVCFQTSELRAGRWTRRDNVFLGGKTLGVIGTGAIGQAVIRLARAIGMHIIVWTFHPDDKLAANLGFNYVTFDQLLRTSDVVSLHVRLSEQSRRLIARRELELMKPGALLINTARGAIVDTDALVEELIRGHLGGAAIDVFDTEPLPADHPLLSCEQIVLTPHSADQTPEGMDLLNSGAVDNVLAFIAGNPRNVVT